MADWGPISKAVTRGKTVAGEEGAVTQPTPSRPSAAPRHEVRYDATDSRHNLETGFRPWESVDDNSGTASQADWARTGPFPDGPGPWRQT